MTIRTAVVILASVFVFGCGGAKKGAADAGDAAGDAMDDAGDAMDDAGDAADGAGDAADDASDDAGGIMRDADGDGEEDKAMACSDMPETRCKISADCAWSDDGKCVEAGGGM